MKSAGDGCCRTDGMQTPVDRPVLPLVLGTAAALSCYHCSVPSRQGGWSQNHPVDGEHPRGPPWLSCSKAPKESHKAPAGDTSKEQLHLALQGQCSGEWDIVTATRLSLFAPKELLERFEEGKGRMTQNCLATSVLLFRCDPEIRQRIFIQLLQCPWCSACHLSLWRLHSGKQACTGPPEHTP